MISTSSKAISRSPQHRAIAQQIKTLIRERGFRPGDRLPSERELARQWNVAHSALRMANALLIQEKWVVRRHGSGTFVGSAMEESEGGESEKAARNIGYLAVGSELAGNMVQQFRRLEAVARQHKLRLLFGSLDVHDIRSLPLNFLEENVIGAIVDGAIDADHLSRLARAGIPIVVAGNHPIVSGVAQIRFNAVSFADQVVRHLAAAGHSTIWCALEPLRIFYTRELLEGYSRAMRQLRLAPELIVFHHHDENEHLVEQFSQSFNLFGPKQAILFAEKPAALLQRLEASGISTESLDIVVSGKPDPSTPAWCNHFSFPLDALNEMAPRLLVDLINGKAVKSVTFEPTVTSSMVDGHLKINVSWKPQERALDSDNDASF